MVKAKQFEQMLANNIDNNNHKVQLEHLEQIKASIPSKHLPGTHRIPGRRLRSASLRHDMKKRTGLENVLLMIALYVESNQDELLFKSICNKAVQLGKSDGWVQNLVDLIRNNKKAAQEPQFNDEHEQNMKCKLPEEMESTKVPEVAVTENLRADGVLEPKVRNVESTHVECQTEEMYAVPKTCVKGCILL